MTEPAPIEGLWLPRVRRVPSPNRDERPVRASIELVVIHNISLPPGQFGTGMVERFFCNTLDCSLDPQLADLRDVTVSAHLVIDRRGRATQFVPFNQRAWHAGESSWRGRPGCNNYAIGIELEGTDERPYTQRQYERLARVLDWLMRRYPALDVAALVGHNEIAPGRKTDPGAELRLGASIPIVAVALTAAPPLRGVRRQQDRRRGRNPAAQPHKRRASAKLHSADAHASLRSIRHAHARGS